MSYTPELVAELEILALFPLDSTQEGLKVHQTAAPSAIAAAKRLFDKKLIDQPDWGLSDQPWPRCCRASANPADHLDHCHEQRSRLIPDAAHGVRRRGFRGRRLSDCKILTPKNYFPLNLLRF